MREPTIKLAVNNTLRDFINRKDYSNRICGTETRLDHLHRCKLLLVLLLEYPVSSRGSWIIYNDIANHPLHKKPTRLFRTTCRDFCSGLWVSEDQPASSFFMLQVLQHQGCIYKSLWDLVGTTAEIKRRLLNKDVKGKDSVEICSIGFLQPDLKGIIAKAVFIINY